MGGVDRYGGGGCRNSPVGRVHGGHACCSGGSEPHANSYCAAGLCGRRWSAVPGAVWDGRAPPKKRRQRTSKRRCFWPAGGSKIEVLWV
jgi:hypothetical protein